jgi:AsmA family protein
VKEFFRKHTALKWTLISLVGLIAVLVVVVSLLDWNMLRAPIARMISAKTGHPASIDGNLSAHVWSWDPTMTVEGLDIRNASWAEQKSLLRVQKITIQVSLGRLLRGDLVFPQIELISPEVNLEREKSGRANWNPESSPAKAAEASPHIPAIRRLIIQQGKVHVVDHVRKLSFNGTLVADEKASTPDNSAFQLHCSGSLNGRPFKLQADGGPLVNVDPHKPYVFTIDVTAGDLSLKVQGSIPKPFDLAAYEAKFSLSGDDLADAFYLTNLALPNTSKYRLAGTLQHQGNEFHIEDFHGTVGSSDISGKLSIALRKSRPKLTAELTSKSLNIEDLAPTVGAKLPPKGSANPTPAASAAKTVPASAWLLPDADLQVNRVRGMDADVLFKAQALNSPKLPLKHLQIHLTLDNGVLRLDPLSFTLPQGQFVGTVQINASTLIPESDIDMHLENIDLAQFKGASAKAPAFEGMLAGRIKLHGTGGSVHKFASTADGSVNIVVPHGEIRAVLAELTGINLSRGLGLLLTKNEQETELRCGVGAFQADKGQLNAKMLVMDTTNVLITGGGDINLQTERLDLNLQGKPKKIRLLRLRSPVLVEGTLSKPKVGIDTEKTVLQVGAATVLGTLLSPIGAILAFVDPGLAKNADCAALLAQAGPSVADAR